MEQGEDPGADETPSVEPELPATDQSPAADPPGADAPQNFDPPPVLVPSAQTDASGGGVLAGPLFATAAPLATAGAIPAAVPALEPSAVHVALAATRPPRVGETVSGALDLALVSSRRVRRASIYIGIVTLALAGPAVILFLALVRDLGSFDAAIDLFSGEQFVPADARTISLFGFATLLAAIGLVGITLEGQIMATAILGGAASGRTIGLRRSLRLSRAVFWKVFGAAVLVGIVDRAVTLTTAAVIGGSTGDSELATIVEVAASGLATMPFGFYQAGIILGGVGAVEAIRRSTRIARARWRLALLVAATGIVLSYIEIFALGAGLDIVLRVADAAGLGFNGSELTAVVSVLLVLATIVAIGSLIVTIAALVAAPQIYVFVKMTGYTAGLDRAMAAPWPETTKPPRLLTWPMVGVIAVGFLCAIVGLPSA